MKILKKNISKICSPPRLQIRAAKQQQPEQEQQKLPAWGVFI